MGRLDQRTCLIIGGTGGIGRACAHRFVAEGARVVVTGHDEAECRAFAGSGDLPALVLDCTDESAVQTVMDRALEHLGGRLDILVHVAGISGRRFGDGPLDQCSAQGWDTVLATNARGVFLTNRAAVRQMLGQAIDPSGLRGSIVNVGSVLATSPSPELFGTVAYAASKGAVEALTRASAARYASERIRFSLLAPGLIDTPMAQRAVQDPTIRAYLVDKQPMRHGPGSPEDCAEAALFLVEPATRFLTGIFLEVAGGWSLSEGNSRP